MNSRPRLSDWTGFARWGVSDLPIRHDPAIGRFIQADSIVPAPGNPQSLNRYAYVYNNPLRYVDSTGHIPVLATALMGAAVGGTVAYSAQVWTNYRDGQPLSEAALNVDWGKVAGAAVGGAVAGFTMGLGTCLGAGLGGTLVAGGVGGAAGGQAAAVAEAGVTQLRERLGGNDWDSAQLREDAVHLGYGNPTKMAYDAAGGAVGAGAGYGLSKAGTAVLARFGDQTIESGVSTIRIRPAGTGGPRFYPVRETREVILPTSAFETAMKAVGTASWDFTSAYLQQFVERYFRWWAWNTFETNPIPN